MQTQWSNWLAAESAAGRSGIVLSGHPIVRGQAYELVLPIPADVSGDAFDGALYVGPDSENEALVSFSVTVGGYSGGFTNVTLALSATDTDDEPPADANLDGLSEVILKLNYTPSGGAKARCLGLSIPVVE